MLIKKVGTGKIKSQDRFRFDEHQPTNVDLTASTGTVEKIDKIVMSDPDDYDFLIAGWN